MCGALRQMADKDQSHISADKKSDRQTDRYTDGRTNERITELKTICHLIF